jgi:hypothetical protein
MTEGPSRAVRLYGTDESVEPPRLLRAGPLSAEFEAGNLRYIRYGGAEVLRAISFIVRDRDWGTYSPRLDDLRIEETADAFRVTYRAEARDAEQAFLWEATITGSAAGRLDFAAEGLAMTDFVTNRTGFVVLHAAALAGRPVAVEHVDGRRIEAAFPRLIDPVQPFGDIRALTHRRDGLVITCRMEGDIFEMEDQRNWTDASFKTYVRPLALPWPYRIAKDERIGQKVSLVIEGAAPSVAQAGPVRLSLGSPAGRMPGIGLGLDPDDAADVIARADSLASVGIRHLICHHDPRSGHDRESLARQVDAARALGAEPWLEAVIVGIEDFAAEIAHLGAMAEALGSPFTTVLVAPAADLKSTTPGAAWPPAPPAAVLYAAARSAFPRSRIGGGMFSYFTELNRKRPPGGALDLVSFTTSAVVHAGDDRSVMETLEALPWIAESMEAIAGATPWAVGPSAIGMRHNPYGAAPKANPGNIRQAMSYNDPRQRGLFGAAFCLGLVAAFAEGGAQAVAFGAPVGAFGVAHAPRPFPQPWFDEAGGGLFPVFHILRGLARLADAPIRRVEVEPPGRLVGLAASLLEGGSEVWLGNRGGETVQVTLPGTTRSRAILDAAAFTEAAVSADLLDRLIPGEGVVELDAHAVVRLRLGP